MKNKNFDVIVVAGQSNAEGNGLGNEELAYKRKENVFMLRAKKQAFFETVSGKPILNVDKTFEYEIAVAEERDTENGKAGAFVYSFVDEYLKKGLLEKGRNILIVQTAVGGTGFCRNEWGKNAVLYNRLKKFLDDVLSFGGKNRVVALLWHQGECDAYEQPNISLQERYAFYYDGFSGLVNDFLGRYGKDIPIIAGNFCAECIETDVEKHKAVAQATKDVLKTVKKSGYAESDGLLSNNQAIKNGDEAHFCRKSCVEFGKRYFNLYENGLK